MKRLALLTLMLTILFAMLTVGIQTYAQTRSGDNPIKAYGFEVCDGKPCFMGVRPGMGWDEARALLTARGLTIEDKELPDLATVRVRGILVVMQLDRARQHVMTINIMTMNIQLYADGSTRFPPLGNFVLQYGPPCAASFTTNTVVMRYPDLIIQYIPVQGGVSTQSNSLHILLADGKFCAPKPGDTR